MRKVLAVPVRLRSGHNLQKPVSWLELFFDLVFVAAIAQVGAPLAHDYSFAGLARYTFLLFLIWWAWLGHTMFNTRFISEDPLQRFLTLAQIFAIAVMAANAKDALSSRDAAGFAAAYAAMRIVLVAQYLRARGLQEAKRLATLHAFGFSIAAAFWLAAAFAETPLRFWIWAIALSIDLLTPVLSFHYTHRLPPDPGHVPERFGLFTIILMGESVMATMRGIESQEGWFLQAASSAILGLCLAFGYWWWYFDQSGAAEERRVDSRQRAMVFHIWCYAHFVLYLAIAVTGVGVEHAISLAEGEHIHREGATLFLSAVAAFMITMVVISYASPRRPNWSSLARSAAVTAILLTALPVAPNLPPSVLLGFVVSACALQIILASPSRANGRSINALPIAVEVAQE